MEMRIHIHLDLSSWSLNNWIWDSINFISVFLIWGSQDRFQGATEALRGSQGVTGDTVGEYRDTSPSVI